MKGLERHNTIVITGGTGYIGGRCVLSLAERGYRVVAVDKITPEERGIAFPPAVTFRQGDLRDAACAREFFQGAAVILHLAANIGPLGYMHERQAEIIRDNCLIDASVYEAARAAGKPCVVYASSSMVFQHAAAYPYRESDLASARIPTNVYGFSKLAGEFFCRAYAAEHGLPYVILRYHNIYGPGENAKGSGPGDIHVIPSLIERVLAKQYPLVLLGGAAATRPFTYIDDAVEVTVLIVERALAGDMKVIGTDFNIGTRESVSIETLARIIWEMFGDSRPFRCVVRDTEAISAERREMLDEKVKNTIGWEPRVDLREGIRRTAAWIREKTERK